VLDLKDSGAVDLKEFVHGFFKIYYSNLETKMKMAFDIYDFDKDGFIEKEDVRIILSHIPVNNCVSGAVAQEGFFTQEGGGSQVFVDRMETQEEIHKLVSTVFGDRKRLSFEQFQDVNMNDSSELFLSVLLLLQSSMPCSENFNRYKNNYEKYLSANPEAANKPKSEQEVRMIASPRLMSKLNPISQMNLDPTAVNLNPDSQKLLLKHASQQPITQKLTESNDAEEGSSTQEVAISNFKSNKLSQINKKQRADEMQQMISEGKDAVDIDAAVRQSNVIKKNANVCAQDALASQNQGMASPSGFLNG